MLRLPLYEVTLVRSDGSLIYWSTAALGVEDAKTRARRHLIDPAGATVLSATEQPTLPAGRRPDLKQ